MKFIPTSFKSCAVSLSKLANKELKVVWNKFFIKENGYLFGADNETMSKVLGINLLNGTLSNTGKILVFILTKKHCIDAIKN